MTTTAAREQNADVMAERQQVLDRIGGHTLLDTLDRIAEERTDHPAFSDRHGTTAEDGWRTLTWTQTRTLARDIAAGLVHRGMAAGDLVAMMASNRVEHMVCDMAALQAGGVPMTVYSTLSDAQVEYVAGQTHPSVVLLENADHLGRWATALEHPGVRTVVTLDPEFPTPGGDDRFVTWQALAAEGAAHRDRVADELAARAAAVTPQDPATILFTSGTTGHPKGVVLTHENVLYETAAVLESGGLHEPLRQISYLPLAHIAERVLTLYGPQVLGGQVYCIGDHSELLATLGQVRPTAFFGVPRVWEKVKTGLSAMLAAEPDEAARQKVLDSMAAARAWVAAQEVGGTMTPEIEAAHEAAEAEILGFLKSMLGLDQAAFCASAAAPMPLDVAQFMAGLGLTVYDVYGMTETTGSFTANGPGGFKLGTVGRPLPGVEVKLGEDGEVLCRGPLNTPGYHANPEATAALVDADGWVHTGDIGTVDADGFYSIVDRKKELIITSLGKNIAPSNLENLLKEAPLVGHAMVIGDNRPYVVAVLTLDGEIAPLVAGKLGIEFTDLVELARHPAIVAQVEAAVETANQRLSGPERIKKWTLLGNEWTAESAELTPTLKLKRRVVLDNYSDAIEAMY